MKMRFPTVIILMMAILFYQLPHKTHAENPEQDANVPISFKVEMLPWEEVDPIIPRYSKFEVVDVETGARFLVQRRAGSKHADVQPLTKEDTKIMKEIYQGKWSWKRRSILVLQDDKLIAASMHGMPHGAGALKNGFPGHFCIHFFGSTTHRSRSADLSHKVMIYKAAGKFDEYIHQVDPYELVGVLVVAMNHKEQFMMDRLLTDVSEKDKTKLENIIKNIDTISIRKIHTVPNHSFENELIAKIPVELQVFPNGRKSETKKVDIIVERHALIDQWRIDAKALIEAYK